MFCGKKVIGLINPTKLAKEWDIYKFYGKNHSKVFLPMCKNKARL